MLKGNLVILAVVALVLSMFLLGVSDSKASVGDTNVANAEVSGAEVASNETQAEEAPASSSATITITWHTKPAN